MAILGDLPHELIYQVCSILMLESLIAKTSARRRRLAALQARHALSRFSQTCSRYRSLAQPLLFRCFGDMIFRPRTRHRFLQAMLDRPELAKEVRYINPGQVQAGKTSTVEDNTRLFEKAARILGTGNTEEILSRLMANSAPYGDREEEEDDIEDIIVPILLAFLPNLRAIKFSLSATPEANPILLRIPTVLDLIPGCRKLESLNVFSGDWRWKFRLGNDNLLMLTIPSLRKVSLHSCFCNDIELKPGTLEIIDLSLETTYINRSNLRILLQACRALKSFRFKWSKYSIDASLGVDLASSQEIITALKQHKASLKSISLGLQEQLPFLYELEYMDITAARAAFSEAQSFSEFSTLEHLTVDQWTITSNEGGFDQGHETPCSPWSLVRLLPAQLKSLTFDLITPASEPLQQLAIQLEKDFPALSLVVVQAAFMSWVKELHHLTPQFKQAGTTFRIQSSGQFEDENQDSWDCDPVFEVLTVGDLLEHE